MTSTPPPGTTHEKVEAPHKFQRRRLGEILGVGPRTSFAAMCGVVRQALAERDRLRADAAEAVESTEYRVTTTRPDGQRVTFDARDFQAQFWLNNGGTDGYPPALVECRTVTTVTSRSGWRPVDTGRDR